MEERILAICNPFARCGRGLAVGRKLEALSNEYGWKLDVRYTQPDGEENSAFNLAVWAAEENYQLILIIGGDGVVNAVVYGLLSVKAEIPVAILPCGVGNDLAKGLGIPRKFEEALKVAFGDVERSMDILKITPDGNGDRSQFIVNIGSLGLDAKLVWNIPALKKKLKNIPPYFLYVIAFIKEVFLPFEYPIVTIRFLEKGKVKEITEKITLLALCNGKQYGGFFKVAPLAEFDSGEFIVCLIKQMAKWMIVAKLFHFVLGIHSRDRKRVMIFSVLELEVIFHQKGIPFQIDGDSSGILEGEERCKITILPGALRVKVREVVVLK